MQDKWSIEGKWENFQGGKWENFQGGKGQISRREKTGQIVKGGVQRVQTFVQGGAGVPFAP